MKLTRDDCEALIKLIDTLTKPGDVFIWKYDSKGLRQPHGVTDEMRTALLKVHQEASCQRRKLVPQSTPLSSPLSLT